MDGVVGRRRRPAVGRCPVVVAAIGVAHRLFGHVAIGVVPGACIQELARADLLHVGPAFGKRVLARVAAGLAGAPLP